MAPIRFIHAADLHLDAAFSGLSKDAPAALVSVLQDASFVALQRLVALCEQEQPDMLLLSGDIYNQEDRSLRAQLALRDACLRLQELGIPVYIIHGNHDPLASGLQSLQWPANVTVFGDQVTAVPCYGRSAAKHAHSASAIPSAIPSALTASSSLEDSLPEADGTPSEPLAMIYGVSHASARETRNLAARFQRDACCVAGAQHCPHIALLHATYGDANGEARYAPFTLDDLVNAGMDYWALGHIHDRRVVCPRPLAVYPGCTQGLHINEQGEKGCLLVSATPDPDGQGGHGWVFQTTFRPLASVQWQVVEVALEAASPDVSRSLDPSVFDGAQSESVQHIAVSEVAMASVETSPEGASDSVDELPELSLSEDEQLVLIESRLRATLEAVANELWTGCKVLIVRLRLTGRTPLNSALRRESFVSLLLERLRDLPVETAQGATVWIKDVDVLTRPVADRASLLERQDLLGEIMRLSESFRASEATLEALQKAALDKLFNHARARKPLETLTTNDMLRLLDDAESLCMDLLEND